MKDNPLCKEKYPIIRSSRSTIAIVIDKEGRVTVRAPYRVGNKAIDEFINSKRGWITQKRDNIIKNKASKMTFHEGSNIWFLGEEYRLDYQDIDTRLDKENKVLYVSLKHRDAPKEYITEWYKKMARTILWERLEFLSKKLDIPYGRFSLSSAKTRWGSCGAKNSINLSWRLVLCPMFVIDYVIVHELCHTRHKNHQKGFWKEVENFYPRLKEAEKWLKQNKNITNSLD